MKENNSKFYFVTGCAGFIGFHFSKRLLDEGCNVIGLDNLNDYYIPQLKIDRLKILKKYNTFSFFEGSVENTELLENLFAKNDFAAVIHLAAQAGVRYSLENPYQYVQTNVVGFMNILECCKKWQNAHLLYASSSSIYGSNKNIPFSVNDCTEKPVSIYGATKKANELMAYTYSHLYNLPTTGLRFFTVYGPWGRPDMALFSFTDAIIRQKPIEVYNYGNMKRDFTYIDDVVESMVRLLKRGASSEPMPYKIYNIGHNKPVELNYLIQCLEKELGMRTKKIPLPLQPGEVIETFANIDELEADVCYKPIVAIEKGVKRFVEWYKNYYKIT